jgi:hypothetical protein
MILPTSLLAGVLWNQVSPSVPFAFGALVAFLAFIVILFLPKSTNMHNLEI